MCVCVCVCDIQHTHANTTTSIHAGSTTAAAAAHCMPARSPPARSPPARSPPVVSIAGWGHVCSTVVIGQPCAAVMGVCGPYTLYPSVDTIPYSRVCARVYVCTRM